MPQQIFMLIVIETHSVVLEHAQEEVINLLGDIKDVSNAGGGVHFNIL